MAQDDGSQGSVCKDPMGKKISTCKAGLKCVNDMKDDDMGGIKNPWHCVGSGKNGGGGSGGSNQNPDPFSPPPSPPYGGHSAPPPSPSSRVCPLSGPGKNAAIQKIMANCCAQIGGGHRRRLQGCTLISCSTACAPIFVSAYSNCQSTAIGKSLRGLANARSFVAKCKAMLGGGGGGGGSSEVRPRAVSESDLDSEMRSQMGSELDSERGGESRDGPTP